MGLVPSLEFMRINTITQMLESSSTKSGVRLLTTGLLASPTRMSGPI